MQPIGLFTEGYTKPPVFINSIEVDLGNIAKHSGSFNVSGGPFTAAKQVVILQAAGPYSNKGTREDEAEMDVLSVVAYVLNATTLKAFWNCAPKGGPVKGAFKFGYVLGF